MPQSSLCSKFSLSLSMEIKVYSAVKKETAIVYVSLIVIKRSQNICCENGLFSNRITQCHIVCTNKMNDNGDLSLIHLILSYSSFAAIGWPAWHFVVNNDNKKGNLIEFGFVLR